jgi:hypothetical protein
MDKQLAKLEDLLHREIDAHQRLLALVARKLKALSSADQKQVVACLKEENQQVQAIGELAKARLVVVAELTQCVDPAAKEPLRLGDLAARLPEPARGRLLVLRQELRARMEQLRRETGITRQAAQALVGHMHGLVRSVSEAMTGIGVYGRGGTLPRAATVISTFHTTA